MVVEARIPSIAATTRAIDQRAKHDERVEVLCQIRGVGPYTAMLVIAEVGRCRPLCEGAQAVRLGEADPDRALIRWQGAPGLHQPSGLAAVALGAHRGGAAQRARLGAAARGLRADRKAPWTQDRQGRGPRARSSPSATTACATERSVAWCAAAGQARQQSWRAPREPRRRLACAAASGRDADARASSLFVMVSPTERTAAHLIEPPSLGRHSSPLGVTGWMTGALPFFPRSASRKGRPTTRGP